MQRIIGHHDGGGYHPSVVSKNAYHRLITEDGSVVDGTHPIEANSPQRKLVAGSYAAHCLNLNSGSIGLAICAMHNADWADPWGSTKFPVTYEQVQSFVKETARLCRLYGIPVTRRTVLTHAEVQTTLGVKQKSKWDFDYDIFNGSSTRDPLVVGDEWRRRVELALLGTAHVVPTLNDKPTLRQGTRGEDVKLLQSLLGLKADGIFGPQTANAVIRFQRSRQLLPDGIVGPATWAALGTLK